MNNLLSIKFSNMNEEAESFIKGIEKEMIIKLLDDAKKRVEEGMYQVDASLPSGEITLIIK